MDQAEYVRAARAIQEANMAKIGRRYLGSRRTIRLLAEMARQIETKLRSLDPPPDDAAAIEEHFIRPWSEYAKFLEAMAGTRVPRWLGPSGTRRFLAEAPGAPQDREEDIDFCNAYGLGDPESADLG
ncbi:MAG TPA: hypothetical protein VMS00_02720 [Acidimicrobiales bacterium]|nr:hypothetical protein [Acidimicrobiales bacterium]